jgi:hypothetical protein
MSLDMEVRFFLALFRNSQRSNSSLSFNNIAHPPRLLLQEVPEGEINGIARHKTIGEASKDINLIL